MAKQDYLPKIEGDFILWFNNFQTKLATYQVALDLTVAETGAVANDYAASFMALQTAAQAKQELKEWVTYKNLTLYGPVGGPTPPVPSWPGPLAITQVAPGVIARIRAMAKRVKAHPDYTDVIGQDLGIIGPEEVVPAEIKPEGAAQSLAGASVEISFSKSGFDGVDIESQRGAEVAWTYLAFDTFSPYVDARPNLVAGQPEQRRYRLRYRDADLPIGLYSDTLAVNVGG